MGFVHLKMLLLKYVSYAVHNVQAHFVCTAKISKHQMPNDQMPNYGVQTQYVSISSTS